MKAVLLAGGIGSRLYPLTLSVSKQLLPVYDKPMVYYPLSVLIMSGIREILIISTREDIGSYKRLLGDGGRYGIKLEYKVQEHPKGLADAFILGEDFIGENPVCLILGDNIFYGMDFSEKLDLVVKRTTLENKATIFGYTVNNPQRYGVIELDSDGYGISLEEKPINPRSNEAVVGLYFYPNSVIEVAKTITPSERGELEITSVNDYYLNTGELVVEKLGPGFTWLDTGTPESLLEAGQFIETIEKRQGVKVGCLEELAFQKGYISKNRMLDQAAEMKDTSYGEYLIRKYS
ncbi:MAG: glucose-1-phosphate thymidylyltransferase [Flavobacteriaceae bacterium TMED179]|nr:MAG: glucose-1-phosphate thymidylyltransferase [Flavobacteriaceae bacterium TMED179]|tara:strand:- start:76417 stop:77289 length:873 start_codon:yes stop_codon:yes gene_type:complete